MSAEPAIPPGPRLPRPIQTLGWITRPMPFMERCRERYGDVFTLRIAQEGTWVLVADPDLVKQVFTGDPELLHAGEGNRILGPVLGSHSVLLLDEQPHMAQRKVLLPPFHGERMKRYGDLMAEVAAEEIASWPRGVPLELWPRMQAITLEVIIRAVFGVHEGERLEQLRERLRGMLELVTVRPVMVLVALLGPGRITGLTQTFKVFDPVDRVIYDEIRDRRGREDLAERDDILSLLLQARHEDGSPMSDEELRDELVTLLVAGHETTATALSWAVERLLRNPDALARLTEEAHAGEDAYVDAVIKETLRLRPVLPLVVRQLTAPMQLGEHLLPAGVTVAPCIHLIHRREDVYPEPRRFRPERFLEQPEPDDPGGDRSGEPGRRAVAKPGTYTWIPFGGGVRRCLGASFALFEMKVVLEQLVRSARLAPARPQGERVTRRAITLTPERGTEVVVEQHLTGKREPEREAVAL